MSLEKQSGEEKKMDLVKEMSFPKYEYQSPKTGSGSVSERKDNEPVRVFESLRNLNSNN